MRLVLVLLALLLSGGLSAQSYFRDVKDVDSLQKTAPKPVLVFINTSWCKYCRLMEQTVFTKPQLAALLTSKFYAVSLNAEDKRELKLGGKTFNYQPTGNQSGYHELASFLGKTEGELTYPALCFMNEELEIVYQRAGYLNSKDLLKLAEAMAK